MFSLWFLKILLLLFLFLLESSYFYIYDQMQNNIIFMHIIYFENIPVDFFLYCPNMSILRKNENIRGEEGGRVFWCMITLQNTLTSHLTMIVGISQDAKFYDFTYISNCSCDYGIHLRFILGVIWSQHGLDICISGKLH